MMTIHSFQLAAFARASEGRFEADVVTHLRATHVGARIASKRSLLELVRAQIAKGESYGLSTERQLVTYVETAWLLGVDFDDRFGALGRVLRTKATDPEQKARFLLDHTRELFAILQGGR